jgi:RES domain
MPLSGPPNDFDRVELALVEVEPAALLRLAFRAVATHLPFRTSARYRFDAPAGQFGVLYAAFDLATAFSETVLRTAPQLAPAGQEPLLTYEELSKRRVVQLAPVAGGEPLRMIKLYDAGLAAAQTDNRIATDDDYGTTRLWAQSFWSHPIKADGIVYLSRFMGARRSVVLFDRCRSRIRRGRVLPLMRHADFPALVADFRLAITRPRRRKT